MHEATSVQAMYTIQTDPENGCVHAHVFCRCVCGGVTGAAATTTKLYGWFGVRKFMNEYRS